MEVVEVVELETTDPALRGVVTLTSHTLGCKRRQRCAAVHDGLQRGLPVRKPCLPKSHLPFRRSGRQPSLHRSP
jgi:hypothetical protein